MDQKGVERREPEEEPDAQNGNVDRVYVRTDRISASSSSSALRCTSHLSPVFFISKLSEMRRPRTFRHGHSASRPIISINLGELYRTPDSASFAREPLVTPPENCFRSAQTTTRRRRSNRAFVSRGIDSITNSSVERDALRVHIRIFKTTSESGLTTAENSDARCHEIASLPLPPLPSPLPPK